MCEVMEKYMSEAKAEGKAEGIAEGKAEGKAEGRLEQLIELVQNGIIQITDAADAAKMSQAQFSELLANK